MTGGRPVVVVTGGGGGIGAAVAEALGRGGWFVVTMDPLMSLDGTERLPQPEETTAGRITAAGGTARASAVSVTDRQAVHDELHLIVGELGRLDAVVNVAGITRPTGFATGTEEDWRSVLAVHLDGYRNVLDATLPIMAAAGRGRVLGVTSGSGWRSADAGAYSCAKRAVASLTWELGREAPLGVAVNAMSPIAVTRMVTAALARATGGRAQGSSSTGGLSLGSMPEPDELGPLGAHLVGESFAWCRGQVIFVGGSEAAVIDPPRFLEVIRAEAGRTLAQVLETVGNGVLVPAEASQASGGGSNPRFGSSFATSSAEELPSSAVRRCALITDRPDLAAAITDALDGRVAVYHTVPADEPASGFGGAARTLAAAAERSGPFDGVVVALAGGPPASGAASAWERVLAEHEGIVEQIHADAGWTRAVAEYSASADRPVRLVTLTEATTAGGRSRAQAAAQLARAGRRATDGRVAAFAMGVEGSGPAAIAPAAELVAHLLCSPDAEALGGGELAAGAGWVGLRSHPRPGGSIVLGGCDVPPWFDSTMREIVGARQEEGA